MPNGLIIQVLTLAGLAFVMVTLVLYTLAHQMGRSIERYDLIRQACLQRQDYMDQVADRRRGINTDYDNAEPVHNADADGYNVDLIEDEPPLRQAA